MDGSERMEHRCQGRLHLTSKSPQIEIRALGNGQDRKAHAIGKTKIPSQQQIGKNLSGAGDYMP